MAHQHQYAWAAEQSQGPTEEEMQDCKT